MGGNALKHILETRRYSREEFLPLSSQIEDRLRGIFGKAKIVPYYRSKDSFGDLDILCENSNGYSNDDFKREISREFEPFGVVINDSCISFNVNELQVDAIVQVPKYYQSHFNYLSYNDLGNLVGRISKSVFDVKYGHKGLSAPVRIDNSNEVGEIEISLDLDEIFPFLGFDPNRFHVGFDNLTEIFDYVINSKYFQSSFFDLENLNHINRTRNRKRQTYQDFLKFIEFCGKPERGNKPNYTVDEYFPKVHYMERVLSLQAKGMKLKFAKSLVLEVGRAIYSGRELGEKMIKFGKEISSRGDYTEVVSEMTCVQIEEVLRRV